MSRITKRKYVVQEVLDYVVPTGNQQIVQITGGRGNNLHAVVDAKGDNFLVSMPTKFRKNIYIKRGDFVIIDPIEEGDKVRGEITNVLIKDCIEHIQEEGLWPEAFVLETEKEKTESYIEDDLLPPSDSEDDDDDLGFKVVNANKANQLYEDDDEEEDEDDEEEEEDEERGKEEEEEEQGEEQCEDENTVERDTKKCDSEKHERLDDKSARSSKDSEVDSLAKGIEQLTAT